MSRLVAHWLLALVAVVSYSSHAQTSDAAQIRTVRAQSNRAILTRDLPMLMGTMLPDMQVTAGSGRHLASRDSVQALFAKTFADKAFLEYVRTIDSVQVSTMNPLAAEHGHWVGRWQRPDGIQTVTGTYLAQWRKTEMGWKIRSELFVSLACTGSNACGK